jgi:hypothetical protein
MQYIIIQLYNSKCWFSTLNKIFKILKLDIKDLADNSVFRNNLIEYYHQQSDSQLQKNKSATVDSKLILFSNIFIPNLETNLSKSIKSKITWKKVFLISLYLWHDIKKKILLSLLQYSICSIVLLLEF